MPSRRRFESMRSHCVSLLVIALVNAEAGLADGAPFDAIDLTAPLAPAALAERLAENRVVFVGETHTRYGDHVNQLAIIEELYALDPNIALGVEYFQQRFQTQVDAYIAGGSSEEELLRNAEYFRGWGYDYRLYAPIFRYAREHGIPVRALNVPPSLPAAVARVGLAGLSEQQRADLPAEIEPASPEYATRLKEAFDAHPDTAPGAFDRFVEAQLVWDEGMAESAAAYAEANPARRLVILVGSGHIAFGSGIPERLERRTGATYAVVMSAAGEELESGIADYLLLGAEQTLPPAGSLGVRLEEVDGQCRIGAVLRGGAAADAGLKNKDVVLAIDGQAVSSIADVRIALWNRQPKERVRVDVRRKRRRQSDELSFDIVLAEST